MKINIDMLQLQSLKEGQRKFLENYIHKIFKQDLKLTDEIVMYRCNATLLLALIEAMDLTVTITNDFCNCDQWDDSKWEIKVFSGDSDYKSYIGNSQNSCKEINTIFHSPNLVDALWNLASEMLPNIEEGANDRQDY